ncbi:MAG TPA: DUF4037 domain-containing protein, partial [Caulobacteraceae bacterium]|nr:DUF4037 domain-containing protein [Caulobacteraceae bacterium]
LGYDDEMSRDHNWGPRVGLFVTQTDFLARANAVVEQFAAFAPRAFLGFPIGISNRPGRTADSDGVRGDPRHGLEVQTIETLLRRELALGPDEPRDALAWLGLSEQQLLVVTAGAVFHDDDGRLTRLRQRLGAFPPDVRLYKLACQWRRVAEEQAFVGRTGLGGDDLGSRVIAARLVRDAMHLAFLIEGRYSPYPKWFGKAFARLPCAAELAPILDRALAAADWRAREAALAEACLALARLHQARELPGAFEPVIGPFHDRPFTVINAEAIGQAIHAEIADPALKALPVIGSLDQVTDSTPVTQAPARARRAIAALFDDGEAAAVEEA